MPAAIRMIVVGPTPDADRDLEMTPTTTSGKPAVLIPIDTSAICDNFAGEEDLLAGLIDAFRGHAPQLLAEIEQGLETRDVALVQRATHTFKGSMGIFGTTPAYDAALALDAAARSGDLDGAAVAFDVVRSSCDRLNAAFDRILGTGN
jgi:HPt (histidine-containing phosphotransfer) domain-containing protein